MLIELGDQVIRMVLDDRMDLRHILLVFTSDPQKGQPIAQLSGGEREARTQGMLGVQA